MTISIDNYALIWSILLMIAFILGYILGKTKQNDGVSNIEDFTAINNKVIKNNISKQKPLIKIDDSTFVTEIKTETMEKKFEKLGETKQSSENINQSINKLKDLKR
jgi:hypothetical protein